MNVQKIQNNNYNTSFGARIIKTKYLEAGLDYAKNHAPIREQDQFLTALKYIAKDNDIDTFTIKADPLSEIKSGQARKSIVEINGKRSYSYENDGFMGSIYDGEQCMSAVTDFIYRHYGFKTAVNVFENKNQWVQKMDELETQKSIATHKAQQALRKGLNSFIAKIKEQ